MSVFHPIIAFGFGAPWMLPWLAVAAAPILIHLWNRRKYREVSWAAMEYLLAAIKKNSRRIRIEQWLLLAIRTLIVVLVVLAISEPFLNPLGLLGAGGQPTLRVLVIDGTLSMAYARDKSRFERAKELARQIVEESPQGDGFALLLLAAPPRVVVGTPAYEPRAMLDEIENLKVTHGGGNLEATLAKVEEIIAAAAREQPRLTHREVYFLTDLGRTTWVADSHAAEAAGDFRARARRLADGGAELVVIDLGQTGCENLVVTSLRASESFATVARDVTFTAEVRNFGVQPRPAQPVQFLVDGQRVKEERIDLAAGGQGAAAFTYRFDAPGNHVVEAQTAGDLLDVDNHRFLALPVKQRLRTLIVDGGADANRGGPEYLVYALDPDAGRDDRGPIHTEVVPESALVELDLKAYDCVFLCNVGQFTAAEAKVLDGYLAQGGGLVFFLGDRVNPQRYNDELGGNVPRVARILPAQLDRAVDDAQYRFNPLAYAHPIVSAFRGREDAGLLNTPVYRYVRLKLWEKSQARVALAFENGDPAIVEEPIRRGRVILVAIPSTIIIDPATRNLWSALPKWPSFVPLVQDMLACAVSGQAGEFNVEVGHALEGAAPSGAVGGALTMPRGDGRPDESASGERRPQSVRLAVSADDGHWSYPDTWYSGVYSASFGVEATQPQTFAVNVAADGDQVESNLEKIDPAELPREFNVRANRSTPDQKPAAQITVRDSWNRWLLSVAACLLFVETMLAWWYGKRAA